MLVYSHQAKNIVIMKTSLYYFIFIALIVLSSSCKKEAPVSDRDQFIGSYTGTMTTMLVADGDIIDYDVVPKKETIEKGIGDDGIIVGKGTESEFSSSVDGTIFLIPARAKQVSVGEGGLLFSITILGQGVLSQNKELTITSSGTENFDDVVFKWTITEKLTKDAESKP